MKAIKDWWAAVESGLRAGLKQYRTYRTKQRNKPSLKAKLEAWAGEKSQPLDGEGEKS